jgi:hypothetical protein
MRGGTSSSRRRSSGAVEVRQKAAKMGSVARRCSELKTESLPLGIEQDFVAAHEKNAAFN